MRKGSLSTNTNHYVNFHMLITFYHVSLLLCNIMIKSSEEIIMNIFNGTSSWGLAISQLSKMLHNHNTIFSNCLGRLLSLVISAIVDTHADESSRLTCHFSKQREGTTGPSSRQAHVTCDLLVWKIPPAQCQATANEKKMT